MNTIRTFLADDHAMVRDDVRFMIEDEADIELIGEAIDGAEALKKIGELLPDVAIIDINMPKMNGLEVIARVKKDYPDVNTIVFSLHDEEEYVLKSIELGAHGYIVKDADKEEFLEGIREVAAGRKFFGKYTDKILQNSYNNDTASW